MSARTTLALLATASVFGLGACGGSSDGGSGSASSGSGSGASSAGDASGPLKRADLATRASAICTDARAQVAKLVAPTGAGSDDESMVANGKYLEQVGAVSRKESDQFAALQADDEAKADWAAVLKGQDKLAAVIEKVAAAAKKKDPNAMDGLGNSAGIGQAYTEAVKKIGAKGCFTN